MSVSRSIAVRDYLGMCCSLRGQDSAAQVSGVCMSEERGCAKWDSLNLREEKYDDPNAGSHFLICDLEKCRSVRRRTQEGRENGPFRCLRSSEVVWFRSAAHTKVVLIRLGCFPLGVTGKVANFLGFFAHWVRL